MSETRTIESLGDLLQVAESWEKKFFGDGYGEPPIWYRGQADASWELQPTVLRDWFIKCASQLNQFNVGPSIDKQLRVLERTVNRQFRRMATPLMAPGSVVDMYFHAQHHGLPTRLLDWTTSSLVALFFAVVSCPDQDGALFVANPRFFIHEDDSRDLSYPSDIVDVRHWLVEAVVESLFTKEAPPAHPLILPILPDLHTGRLRQQSACFTLHMPIIGEEAQNNRNVKRPTESTNSLEKYIIPQGAKGSILVHLRRAGVNWATLFPDLDHICREIRTAWQLFP